MAPVTTTISGKRALAGLAIIVFLPCAFLAYAFAHQIFRARDAEHWPSSQGQVIVSRVVRECRSNGYRPEIRYVYSANGRIYQGDSLNPVPDPCVSQRSAQYTVTRYAVGEVRVWYDPTNPSISALSVGPPIEALHRVLTMLIICTFTLVTACVCLYVDGKASRAKS